MTLTIGVHGPKEIHVFVDDSIFGVIQSRPLTKRRPHRLVAQDEALSRLNRDSNSRGGTKSHYLSGSVR